VSEAAVAEELAPAAGRVTTLELFFDLVFVFTITQLTRVLVVRGDARGLLQVTLMLAVIWWMYGGYAWLTNAVAPSSAARRLLLLGGMAGYLVLALSIPRAFRGTGTAFGLAYLVIVAVHIGLFTRTTRIGIARTMTAIAPFNIASALLVVMGGVSGGWAQYLLWAGACVLEWVTPLIVGIGSFEVNAAHFVERHGLVIIVALGESVVAVAIGVEGLAIGAELVVVAVLGLLLSACLWWVYFGGDDEAAERALAHAPIAERSRLAFDAFGYWHLAMLLGIVGVAAGLKHATAHPTAPMPGWPALFLAGGVSLFLAADVLFRRTLAIGAASWRGACALLALATIPLGTALAAVAELGALVVVLAAGLSSELSGWASRPPAPRAARPGSAGTTPAARR
jgi:low temperature requirement protein LtrA